MNDDGEIAPTFVWHAPLTPGSYDIVIDADRNGVYDAATDGLDSGSPGFVVVPDTPPTDVPTLTPPICNLDRFWYRGMILT